VNPRLLPSALLIALASVLAAASLALLASPGAGLLLAALDVTLAGAALLDWLVTPRPGVLRVVRVAPERVSIAGTDSVILRVGNESRASLFVRLRDSSPPTFRAEPAELTGSVPADDGAEFTYKIHPSRRGKFNYGSIHLRYRSVLGLWERARVVAVPGVTQVYPAVDAVERYDLLARADRLPALGIRRLRVRGAAWEFESLRDFVDGDDTRLMDWKATARRCKLIVRNQEAERSQSVIVLVDSGRLMTAEEGGVSKLDHAINAALLLAHVALARGDRVGMGTFSSSVHAWMAPRAHSGQMRLVTEVLYDLQGDFTESDHARCLRQVALRHNKRALLVVLTDFVDADTAADMVAALRHAARRHVVLFTAFNDPSIERAAHCEPQTEAEGFRKAVAVSLLRERQEVLARLRLSGVQVVDAVPTGVTPALLNKYLEISLRGLV
jgi:uncharacterized protein (DUF58 family)